MRIDTYEITPDSFTGAIAAIEGIKDAAVLLNGPTGCKFYHGALSENQLPRADSLDPLYYSEEFYFGQPRVPATYLDDYDYVFGATDKLEKILPVVAGKGHAFIAVINSPGAALIGDDLLRFIQNAALPVPCIAIENTGFSEPVSSGFQNAVIDVLKTLPLKHREVRKKSVNLIGISIFHHHWQGNISELTTLLGACGITVNAGVCAGCTLSELESIASAECNIVLHGEYADTLTPFIEERYHMESLLSPQGLPIGFESTEAWLISICKRFNVDPGPGFQLIKGARKKSYEALNRFNALSGLPKGATFGVCADTSLVLPLVKWLYQYLGMVPVSVVPGEALPDYEKEIRAFLREIDCKEAWQAAPEDAAPDVFFGSETLISRLRFSGRPFTGIDIALPAGTYQHVIPKKYMGAQGALYLIEKIINGLAGCDV